MYSAIYKFFLIRYNKRKYEEMCNRVAHLSEEVNTVFDESENIPELSSSKALKKVYRKTKEEIINEPIVVSDWAGRVIECIERPYKSEIQ